MLKDILTDRITTKWWLPRSVETEKLNQILETAHISPSKQGKYNHKIYVLGTNEESMMLKKYLFWEDTYCINGIRGLPGPGQKRFNAQVNAPIVLVWIAKRYNSTPSGPNENESDVQRVRDDCIVNATVAMCAAEELGLQTGFCGCVSPYNFVSKITGQPVNRVEETSIITLGIGYGYTEPMHVRSVYHGSVFPIPHPNDQSKHFANAYKLILDNRDFLKEETSAWIQTQTRLKSYPFARFTYDDIKKEKCKRDVELILGAYLHDIQFNTTDSTRTMISYYWERGILRVKNPNIEIYVYQFLNNIINNFILKNVRYNSLQNISNQVIDQSIIAEAESFTKIDMLTVVVLNGLAGQEKLNEVVGQDFANLVPENRTLINRKIRPSLNNFVKYV
jgi:hypothetical protein